MDLLKNAASSVTKAVNFVVDKNRRSAMMNRLRIVIKNERESQARAYIQLGKYYYENMRDAQNTETEPLCSIVDNTGTRLKRAYAKLDELAVPSAGYGSEAQYADDFGTDPESAYEEVEPETEEEQTQPEVDTQGEDTVDMGSVQPDMGSFRQESADDDEEFLRPFSVVPNDGDTVDLPTAKTSDEEKPY